MLTMYQAKFMTMHQHLAALQNSTCHWLHYEKLPTLVNSSNPHSPSMKSTPRRFSDRSSISLQDSAE